MNTPRLVLSVLHADPDSTAPADAPPAAAQAASAAQDSMVRETRVFGGKRIILLGTAHVSKESIEDVRRAAAAYPLSCIAVELDAQRLAKLTGAEDGFEHLDIFTVIKQKKALFLFSSIVLSAFQRRLGESTDARPGAEMLAASEEAARLGVPCALIDRAADITLKRAWGYSSLWSKMKIASSLITMIFSREQLSEEKLSELKTMSLQGQMMEELASFLPNLKHVLLDERDEYLAIKLTETEGECVLAVLGAAHVPGVLAFLQKLSAASAGSSSGSSASSAASSSAGEAEVDAARGEDKKNLRQKKSAAAPIPHDAPSRAARLAELEHIPKKHKIGLLEIIVPLAVIGLMAWGFLKGGTAKGIENIVEWAVLNGGFSFLGAVIAGAHPLTMLVALISAPFASLAPVISVGLFTGLCESLLRRPRVRDFAELHTMKLTIPSFYKNRVTRTLLVIVMTTLGSVAGVVIAFPLLFG